MSMKESKAQLIRLLAEADNKVLALSGRWGTGKTHMWREICASSADDHVKNALYVSLFGTVSMAQVKLKIVQSALGDEKTSAARAAVGSAIKGVRKVLVSLHEGFSAIDEVALLAVPTILKNKVIVLDDIERKHEDLSIDEILGFIDEFTQLHGARFMLVLNSDKLRDQEIWNTLREKVIDQELRLDTSSQEAFDIALALNPSAYAQEICGAVSKCRITNIRVIQKIIKVVNRILGAFQEQLPAPVVLQVVPSTVLLAAIHYHGLENGPDFNYVLAAGGPRLHLPDDVEVNRDEPTQRLHGEWNLLLNELGIVATDEFEMAVVEYLESGLFDIEVVSNVISRYLARHDAVLARGEVKALIDKIIWDHRVSDAELLADAEALLPNVRFLDASYATMLANNVADVEGGSNMSERLVDQWIADLPAHYSPDPDDDMFFHRQLHPRIEATLQAIVQEAHQSTTLLDACSYIAEHSGWGARQELALQAASTDDFESAIRNLEIPDLRRFMRKMLELTASREMYRRHFGNAMDRFAEACGRIVRNEPSSRLSKLIIALFNSYKIAPLLEAQPATPGSVGEGAER